MAIAVFIKDPDAILDYQIDWNDWLQGDTIASSSYDAPAGITVEDDSFTAQTTTVRLSGGTHGTDYELINHIVTASGQEDERSLTIQVRQSEAGSSADATARTHAISTLSEWAQINVAPTLTETEIEVILERNKRARTWTSATPYVPGDVVHPPTANGRRYVCQIGGTSGTTNPFANEIWRTFAGSIISEGSSDPLLTWQEAGPAYPNIYDLRQAAYECWDLRVRRAVQFIDAGDVKMSQVHDHSVRMRDSFAPMGLA